ncbi:MAG: GvpL/GvpF family gas vesicle protein [Beijerinckiaceae bacterium]
MSEAMLIGVGRNAAGDIAPVFVTARETFDAMQHHRAVVTAASGKAFLPVAFGTSLGQDSAAFCKRLSASKMGLGAALDLAGTHVEIGVRLHHSASTVSAEPDRASGRAWLQSSAKRASLQQQQADSMQALLDGWRAHTGVADVRVIDSSGALTRIALMVERQAGAKVAAVIEAAANPDLAVEVSGPWPLYSFGVEQVLA